MDRTTLVSAYIAEADILRQAADRLKDFAESGAFEDVGPDDVTCARVVTLQTVNAALRDVLDMIKGVDN